jgi:hypothetical protein
MKYLPLSVPALLLLICAAIFVAVQREPANAQGRRQIAWDYNVLVVPIGDAGGIESKLQKAGADGWECVSLSFSPGPGPRIAGMGYAVMKRQR